MGTLTYIESRFWFLLLQLLVQYTWRSQVEAEFFFNLETTRRDMQRSTQIGDAHIMYLETMETQEGGDNVRNGEGI